MADFTGAVVLSGTARPGADGLTQVELDGGGRISSTDPGDGRVAASVYPWEIAIEPASESDRGSHQNRVVAEVLTVTAVGNRVRLGLGGPQPLVAEVTAGSRPASWASKPAAGSPRRGRPLPRGSSHSDASRPRDTRVSLRWHRYDPQTIEPRWQSVWADERTWEVSNEPDERPKAYVLEMLPYPSGEPHIGHLKTYSVGDAVAHFRRRSGYRVLHPMGYDAFGLPAENHAIKTGPAPARVDRGVDRASSSGSSGSWGVSIDWTREFGTHEPGTTAGPSGSSCASTSAASPTARRPRSSGVRRTPPCWPTSR